MYYMYLLHLYQRFILNFDTLNYFMARISEISKTCKTHNNYIQCIIKRLDKIQAYTSMPSKDFL